MALINWDDSFSVNVAEIDRQHKNLVSMINELDNAMKQGKGKDVVDKVVDGLIDYTATHFQTEETYFDRFGYPEANSHKREHFAFVRKASEFKYGFAKGKISLAIEIKNFLGDWIQNHIKVTDKKYSKFFNERGLK